MAYRNDPVNRTQGRNVDSYRAMYWTAFVLTVSGAINLGIMGLAEVNVLAALFGGVPWLLRAIYVLIGVAAGLLIYFAARMPAPTRRARRTTTY